MEGSAEKAPGDQAGGGICPQLDVPHCQAGTEIEAVVSIINVKVLFHLRERVGYRQISLTQPGTVSVILNAVLGGLYPWKGH